jgi:CubicO group peptidase (beta-lactamase class C family)
VDTAATKLIADQVTPSLSISVLHDGRFVYSRGFGFANLETQSAATAKWVYLIGSVTKQFTAAAVMLLAEDGKLSVDAPLSTYLPDFPRGAEITLRQMLTHTSGLGDVYGQPLKPGLFARDARLDYDTDALYRLMLSTNPPYAHAPGTVWAYNNEAFTLLGVIVEQLSGQTLGRFMQERIFARAALADTAVDDTADLVPCRASGYVLEGEEPGRWKNAPFIARTFPGGAGSMRSTTEDLCRWHEALLGGKIVSASSLAEMITPNRLKNGALPLSAPDQGSNAPAGPVRYGFGLDLNPIGSRETVSHGGHIAGFSASLISFPKEKLSLALLANCYLATESETTLRDTVIAAALRA